MMDHFQQIRLLEALLFASAEPLRTADLAKFLPDGAEVGELLEELAGLYANRGVNLVRSGERWAFRSAADLAELMRLEKPVKRKLSRAAIETLAIVAYHQPVTRAEIEEIRGVGLSRGTLDTILEMGWIKPRGRRRTPGRPVTWGTTDTFLDHFGLESLDALPGQEELKAAGLLDTRPAITSLAARGMLPVGEGEDREDGDDEDALSDESAADLLDAEFGEDLLPPEADQHAEAGGEDDDVADDEDADDVLAEAAEDDSSDEDWPDDDLGDDEDDDLASEDRGREAPKRAASQAALEQPDDGDDGLEAAAHEAPCRADDPERAPGDGSTVFSRVAAPRGEDGA